MSASPNACVPRTDADLASTCSVPGGAKTIRSPQFVPDVTNFQDQVACVLQDEDNSILYDENGTTLCPDDV